MEYISFLIYFKFQSDSINTLIVTVPPLIVADFKFQSDSINTPKSF